ncbi:dTDP-glucose 4,6-dehydratase [Streptococcus pyogenes]|nr:dTDP-glucose 4,6-dehydratase [Streptococcus pyogenes]
MFHEISFIWFLFLTDSLVVIVTKNETVSDFGHLAPIKQSSQMKHSSVRTRQGGDQ